MSNKTSQNVQNESSQPLDENQGINFTASYPFGWRHIVTLLGFFGFFVLYALRVNMGVAIVSMVNHTALNLEKNTSGKTGHSICNSHATDNMTLNNQTKMSQDGPFVWDSEMQGVMLASFFYGYIMTQFCGGMLSGRYGAKWIFGVGTLGAAVLTLFTPLAANLGPGMLVALRTLEGVFSGVTWSSMLSFLSRWAPPRERSKLPAFAYAGCFVGTPVTFVLSGILAESGFMGGWPSIFYVFGCLGCVWFIAWAVFSSSGPEQHRFISRGEQTYIVKSIEQEHGGTITKPGFRDVPWKKISKSLPFWSVVIAHISYNYGLYVLLTGLPTYFKIVLGFDIKQNGFLSALPYICQATIHMSSGVFADMLRTKYSLRTVVVRKGFDCLGHLLPAIFVICVGFVGCNSAAAIVCLVLCIGSTGLCGAGFYVNLLDIAPQYSGLLFGISNTFATLSGIIGPYITGVLTKDATIEAWRTVFYIIAAIYMVSVIFFALFADGKVQPWAQPKTSHPEEEKK